MSLTFGLDHTQEPFASLVPRTFPGALDFERHVYDFANGRMPLKEPASDAADLD
jgi:hypothetical protein